MGGITRENRRTGGGRHTPSRVILAIVFVSASIFSLAPLPAASPTLDIKITLTPSPPDTPLRLNEGEEEKEGGREGGRSLSYYGK